MNGPHSYCRAGSDRAGGPHHGAKVVLNPKRLRDALVRAPFPHPAGTLLYVLEVASNGVQTYRQIA